MNHHKSKYNKYKNKYLSLKNQSGGAKRKRKENVPNTVLNCEGTLGNTIVYERFNMLSPPPQQYIQYLIEIDKENTVACEFIDEDEIGWMNLDDSTENLIVMVYCHDDNGVNRKEILGYLYYLLNYSNDNQFIISGSVYRSIYVSARCSFTRSNKVRRVYDIIRNQDPNFSFGRHIWNYFIRSIDYGQYLIYNHSTQEALNYHLYNGMQPVDWDNNILETVNIEGTHTVYSVYGNNADDAGDGDLYYLLDNGVFL